MEEYKTYEELTSNLKHIKKYKGIPKIIHQVWFPIKQKEMYECWKETPVEWKRLHPDWTYILWNKELSRDYIKNVQPDFLDAWEKLEYEIQRIDAIRYVFLKRMGGIYSDLDMVPLKRIEDIIDTKADAYFVSEPSAKEYYANSFMIS